MQDYCQIDMDLDIKKYKPGPGKLVFSGLTEFETKQCCNKHSTRVSANWVKN